MNTFRLLVLSLAIISLFPRKHVRVFPETRTRICENTYVFWETDNEVLNAFGKMYNNYVENKHCIPF